MKELSIFLRPARPDFTEGLFFARYLGQAAEGFFAFLLGKDFENIIAKSFSEPNHAFSYENVIFAEQEDKIIGMSSSFTGTQHKNFTEDPINRTAGRSAIRMKINIPPRSKQRGITNGK